MHGSKVLTGLNHITLAVSDLDKALPFYLELLGFDGHARWRNGAYLSLNDLWLCLSVDSAISTRTDYTHIAFSVSRDNFLKMQSRLVYAGVEFWKENKSEGDSIYFYDPDKYKLEIHVGDLDSRLESLALNPYDDLEWL